MTKPSAKRHPAPIPEVSDQSILAVTPMSILQAGRRPDGEAVVVKLPRKDDAGDADGTHTLGWAEITGGIKPWQPDPATLVDGQGAWLEQHGGGLFPRLIQRGVTGGGEAYFLMSAQPGETLREILARRENVASAQLADLVAAMRDFTERTGEIHGDIKPDNIVVTSGGRLSLLDPSDCVTVRDAAGHPLQWLLTPGYCPTLEASDVVALAMVAVEQAVGTLPIFSKRGGDYPLPLSPVAARTVQVRLTMGRGWILERALRAPLPSKLNRKLDPVWDLLYLWALGFEANATGEIDVAPVSLDYESLLGFLEQTDYEDRRPEVTYQLERRRRGKPLVAGDPPSMELPALVEMPPVEAEPAVAAARVEAAATTPSNPSSPSSSTSTSTFTSTEEPDAQGAAEPAAPKPGGSVESKTAQAAKDKLAAIKEKVTKKKGARNVRPTAGGGLSLGGNRRGPAPAPMKREDSGLMEPPSPKPKPKK